MRVFAFGDAPVKPLNRSRSLGRKYVTAGIKSLVGAEYLSQPGATFAAGRR
jgi:hypothetical protein